MKKIFCCKVRTLYQKKIVLFSAHNGALKKHMLTRFKNFLILEKAIYLFIAFWLPFSPVIQFSH